MNQQRPQWRTSSYTGNSGNCVEVAVQAGRTVAVRDSKDPTGPELSFSQRMWQAFTRRTESGAALQ